MRRALFLDRDGVINVDHGYVYQISDFQFVDGIFELVKAANQMGYLVIVVTNQAGIGRGYYSENDFHSLMEWVGNQFKMHGAQLDAVYHSPFHPEHGIGKYRAKTHCRKPAPGMLLQAASEHQIDLKRSILVGDKESDMEAGKNAGVGVLLKFGETCSGLLSKQVCSLNEVLSYMH